MESQLEEEETRIFKKGRWGRIFVLDFIYIENKEISAPPPREIDDRRLMIDDCADFMKIGQPIP